MARLLIVNADDFGLTTGVSHGILSAHDSGIVTSTSVLAVGAAFASTIASLQQSGLGVGAHLAFVGEDPPLLEATEIPTLVDRTGRFRRSWRELGAAVAGRRIDPHDVRREAAAQVARIRDAGVDITHVDSHQHVHLLPPVAKVVLDVAEEVGIGAIRVPGSRRSGLVSRGVRLLAERLRAAARSRGLSCPETFVGLDESGHMTEDSLQSVLWDLAGHTAGSAELGVHPGLDLDPDRSRFDWGFEWGAELAALCSSDVRTAVERAGFRLGTFADL